MPTANSKKEDEDEEEVQETVHTLFEFAQPSAPILSATINLSSLRLPPLQNQE